jgi:cytochrome bd-type quinol oxidase subunit 1
LIGFMGIYAFLGILFLFLVRREIEEGPEQLIEARVIDPLAAL